MSLVRGTGSLTLRGLDIINYCNTNSEALDFNEAYITPHATPNFTEITDPNYIFGLSSGASASEGISKEQMYNDVLSAVQKIPCSISAGEKAYGSSSSILPLVVQFAQNAIDVETALRLYYMFVKDPEGNRYTLGAGEGANFAIGDTVTDGTRSGNVIYVDGDIISVTHQTAPLQTSISGGSNFPGTGTISATSDLYILFYSGCLLYDDAGPTISTLTVVPGMNMPIRTQIRFSSGFPDDISFINTSISEIEIHNADVESHDTTHLRLDGNNSPSTDIDWNSNKLTSLSNGTLQDDATAIKQVRTTSDFTTSHNIGNSSDLYALLTDTLPKQIDHDITINLTSNITISALLGYSPVLFEGFKGKGSITLDLNDNDIDQGLGSTLNQDLIRISGCQIPITITNSGVSTSLLTTRANTLDSAVKIQNCTQLVTVNNIATDLTTGTNLASIKAIGASNVLVGNSQFDNGLYAIFATNNSTILSNNNVTASSPTYGLFATNNSVIMKNGLQPTGAISSQDEVPYRGGIITTDSSFGNAGMSGATFPIISSGTVAPTSTPTKPGDIYVNTSGPTVYIATGNSSSGDWTAVN